MTTLCFACDGTLALEGWDWHSWGEMDEKRRWQYRVDIVGKEVVKDQVKDFFLIYQIAEWFNSRSVYRCPPTRKLVQT